MCMVYFQTHFLRGVLAQLCNLHQVFPFKRTFEVQFKLDKYNNENSVYCEAQKDVNSFCSSVWSTFSELSRSLRSRPAKAAVTSNRCALPSPGPSPVTRAQVKRVNICELITI